MQETMSERLKRLRTAKGTKVEDFARQLGIPATTYREWEKGRAIQGQPYIEISKALDVSLGNLLGVPEVVPMELRKEWLIRDLRQIFNETP